MQKNIQCSQLSKINNSELRSIVLRSFLKSREASPTGSSSSSSSASLSPRINNQKKEFSDSVEKLLNLFLEGKEFRSQGDSINYVFPIQHENNTFAYLKIGKNGEEKSLWI